jgi:hypothetical protein
LTSSVTRNVPAAAGVQVKTPVVAFNAWLPTARRIEVITDGFIGVGVLLADGVLVREADRGLARRRRHIKRQRIAVGIRRHDRIQ